MAEHIIPENAGPYHVIKSMAGTPLVTNGRKGKTKVSSRASHGIKLRTCVGG
jgi:hypothetical protein